MRRQLYRAVWMVLCIGVLMIAGGILLAAFLSGMIDDAMQEHLDTRTEEYRNKIYEKIDADYQILDTFSSIVGGAALMEDEEFPKLLDQANYQNDFLTMVYMDASENITAATLDHEVTENETLANIQPEAREVLERAMEGERSVSPQFQGELSEENVVVYGTPVYQNGEITGALAASGRIDVFQEILDGDTLLEGFGCVSMIDGEGNYILHSGKDQTGQDLKNVFAEPYFAPEEAAEARKELQKNGSLAFSFRYGGDRYRALIQSMGINGWYLFSMMNTRAGSGEIYLMNQVAGTVFIGIILLVLFLMAYGLRMVWKNGKKLNRIAYYDSITGAYNMLRFRQIVEERTKTEKNYSIIALNVHQFKFINEIYGREQGDRVLCCIKEKIEQNLEDGEFFCRENADIFYLYSGDTDRDRLERRLKKIMDSVSQAEEGRYGNYQVLMCCGAAIAREGEEEHTLDQMMSHVMLALVRARDVHQNNVWFFDKELHRKELMENYVESHMNQALEDGEFCLYLQPKVALDSRKTAGAEALVRWVRPDGSMIYPDQFIPLFESNGFCVQLDMYMVESVCRQLRAWMDMGTEPVPVSVNQSKRAFYEKDYISRLTGILEKYRIPAELITLEILEGFALENEEEVNSKIKELQKKGFRVSMDDFGSEYSSLNTLGKIRINELKLDRWFLKEAAAGKRSVKVIMEQIIQLAHKLGISTVVEGVETAEDDRMIRELHCGYGQGYYYSRPVSAGDFFERYLKQE